MRIIRRFKGYYHRVLDLPDAPVKVARGVALGIAVDFFPIPVISIPVAYLLARLIMANGVAAALAAAFFKWAVPFFYLFNFTMGQILTGDRSGIVAVSGGFVRGNFLDTLNVLSYPFFVGAFFNSLLAGTIAYFVIKRLLLFRQKRRDI